MDELHTTYKGRTVARDYKKAEIQLEEFNMCPGTEAVQKWLVEHKIAQYVEVVDWTRAYWHNDYATLVLRVNRTNSNLRVGLEIGKLVDHFDVDEYDFIESGENTFIRIWWD